jgi:predicted metal-dependent peptidase
VASAFKTTVGDRLAAAKLWLTSVPLTRPSGRDGTDDDRPRDLPYLTSALYALIPVASNAVETMSVDRYWRLYVNETWASDVSIHDIAAEMAHCVWHLLREHSERAASLRVDWHSADRWHLAADAALHETLSNDRLAPGDMIPPSLLGLPAGLSAEEYYALMPEPLAMPTSDLSGNSDAHDDPRASPSDDPVPETSFDGDEPFQEPEREGCGSGCDGLARSWELPPNTSAQVDEDSARNIRRSVAIAYREHVTSRGTDPGDAWRWTQEILEPKVPWQPLLSAAVRRAVAWTNGHTHYTYTRRSRRQSALPSFVLPGTRRPVPNVAAVIDTSGSVDDTLLGQALGEVEGALNGLGVAGANLTLLACDAAVHTVTRVRSAKDAKLAGGGGTDLTVGIQHASDLRPKPDVIIVLTDGYTPWPTVPPPGTALIAVLLLREGQTAPPTPQWATRIECRL